MRKLLAIGSLLLLSSCAFDIDYQLPTNRMQTPETTGKQFKPDLSIGFINSADVELAKVSDTIFSSPTVDDKVSIHKDNNLMLAGGIGLIERLDIYAWKIPDGPYFIGPKFQFIGTPGQEGVHASISAGYASMSSLEGSFTNDGETYDGGIELSGIDTSLNIGYRFNSTAIAYINSYYASIETEAEISQNGNKRYITGYTRQYGWLLGTRLTKGQLYLGLETGYAKTLWERYKTDGDYVLGANVGVSF